MTKTGDRGTTGIFGGERVPKDDIRIEANGTMDELNAHLGLIRSHLAMDDPRHRFFGEVQMRIMQAMSLIATRSERREENPNHFELSWTLDRLDPLPEGLIPWVNRMSDWLFVSAKWEMNQQGWPEERWQAFSYKRKRKKEDE